MRHQILIFISLALLIYYGLHTLLFLLLVKFFSLRGGSARFRLGASLFILSLSFIIAFIWLHTRNHGFISWFYYGSALWLGILINLLLIFGAGLLLVTFLKLFSLRRRPQIHWPVSFGPHRHSHPVWPLSCHSDQKDLSYRPHQKYPPGLAGQKNRSNIGYPSGSHQRRKPEPGRLPGLVNEQKVDLVFLTGDILDGNGR